MAMMAPEACYGRDVPQSDQYALATTYFSMRTGRAAFAASDVTSLMFRHAEAVPDLKPLPRAEQEVLARALAKKPEDRFPTCGEFAQALRRAAVS